MTFFDHEMFNASASNKRRLNFLARLFGLFNEEVVRCWCGHDQSRFSYEGRPTVKRIGKRRGHTLDFLLRMRDSAQPKFFVAEMKCWLATQNGKHLRLTDMSFVERYSKESAAFSEFLNFARAPSQFEVTVGKERRDAQGAILIWSAASSSGRRIAVAQGISEVLTVEDMLCQLKGWDCPAWSEKVRQLKEWSNSFFEFLAP
jgi:hypothetical protein